MAKYSPISPAAIVPGITGADSAWSGLIVNATRLYAESTDLGYCPVMLASNLIAYDGVVPTVTGDSYVELCRINVPKNADNHPLMVTVMMSVASGDTGTVQVVYGGATATNTTSNTAPSAVSAVATPSGSGDREAVVSIKGASGSDEVYVRNIQVQLRPVTAPSSAPMASGITEVETVLYTSGQPVSSERVMRLMNYASFISKDRPAAVYSSVEYLGHTGARSAMVSSGTSQTQVVKSDLSIVEGAPRDYRVSMYLDRDGSGVAKCVVSVGSQSVTTTAMGWTHGTITLGGATTTKMTALLSRTSGTGNVYLRTLQIYRST